MEVRIDKTIKIELQEKEANRLITLLNDYSKTESEEIYKFRTNFLSYLTIACK